MGATEKLARFVIDYPADEIPSSILHLAKRCFINFLAVALNASQDASVGILLNLYSATREAARRTSVIGKNFRTNLQNAAMVNGYLGHFLDYDDTHYLNMMHASSPIYPACLAVGEANGVSSTDFLAAYMPSGSKPHVGLAL